MKISQFFLPQDYKSVVKALKDDSVKIHIFLIFQIYIYAFEK